MSKKALFRNHQNFEKQIDYLLEYGIELTQNMSKDKSQNTESGKKSIILEAILLRCCALWESFMENQLVFLVSLDSDILKREIGLPLDTKLNQRLIRALLFFAKQTDYHNLDQSRTKLNKLLSDKYNPFKNLGTERIRFLSFTYKMRNYLSHYSAKSKEQLTVAYEKCYGYQKFLEPGYFLTRENGKRFEELIHNFKLISVSMKSHLR